MMLVVYTDPASGQVVAKTPPAGMDAEAAQAEFTPKGVQSFILDNETFPAADIRAWVLGGDGALSVDQARVDSIETPPVVTPWRLRVALRAIGKLQDVENWVAQQSPDIQDAWEYGLERPINHPLILACARACNLDLPPIFRAAGKVQ